MLGCAPYMRVLSHVLLADVLRRQLDLDRVAISTLPT